jgi:hypothetical protein
MINPRYHLHTYINLQILKENIFLINQFIFQNKLEIVIENGKALINADKFFNDTGKMTQIEFSVVWDISDKAHSFVTGYGLSVEELEDEKINWLNQYFIHMLTQICPSDNLYYRSASLLERYGKVVANNFTYKYSHEFLSFNDVKDNEIYHQINQYLEHHNLSILDEHLTYHPTIHPIYLTPIHYLLSQNEGHNQDESFILPLIKKFHTIGYELYPNVADYHLENSLTQARIKECILTHAFKCEAHIDSLIYLIEHKPESECISYYFLDKFLFHRSTYSHQEKLKLLETMEGISNDSSEYMKLLPLLKERQSVYYEKIEALYLKQKTKGEKENIKKHQKI